MKSAPPSEVRFSYIVELQIINCKAVSKQAKLAVYKPKAVYKRSGL